MSNAPPQAHPDRMLQPRRKAGITLAFHLDAPWPCYTFEGKPCGVFCAGLDAPAPLRHAIGLMIARKSMVTQEQRAAYEQNMLKNIQEHGWFCASVFDPDGKKPNISYTVGLSRTLDHPEIFIAGLPMELSHSMLWSAFDQIKAGNPPQPGKAWADILDGYDVVCQPVHASNTALDVLTSANWFWKTVEGKDEPLEMLQLFWPSGETRLFPWDKDCEQDVIDGQPRLDQVDQAL